MVKFLTGLIVVVEFAGVPLAHSGNESARVLAQATQSDNKPVQLLVQDPVTVQGVCNEICAVVRATCMDDVM